MDIKEIEHFLQQRMIPHERIITKENKKLMKEMHTLYGLDIFDMEKMILCSLEDNRLNVAEFKEACHNLFESKNMHKSSINNAENAKTKEVKLINEFNNVMPEQLLANFSSGKHVSKQDVKIINMEKLHDKYGMNFDVSREIILYGRRVNHNLMINWFLDGVSDYVYRHNGKTLGGVQDLLKVFHDKFVKDFGKD